MKNQDWRTCNVAVGQPIPGKQCEQGAVDLAGLSAEEHRFQSGIGVAEKEEDNTTDDSAHAIANSVELPPPR